MIVKGLRTAERQAWPPTIAFFEWASSLTGTPKETTVEQLQEALDLSKTEAKELAAGIKVAKIGELIVGRRGAKTRIRWKFALPSIAGAARGLSESLEAVNHNNFPVVEGTEETEDAEHSFRLRSNRKIMFNLPRDLKTKEADRLAAFIKTLPLE